MLLKYISTIVIVSLMSILFNFILLDYIYTYYIIEFIIRAIVSFLIGYSALPILRNFDNNSIPYSKHRLHCYSFSSN